jgi:hypothetical protein
MLARSVAGSSGDHDDCLFLRLGRKSGRDENKHEKEEPVSFHDGDGWRAICTLRLI